MWRLGNRLAPPVKLDRKRICIYAQPTLLILDFKREHSFLKRVYSLRTVLGIARFF